MRVPRLWLIPVLLVLLCSPAAAQQGVQINRAIYGVQPSGPSCDATASLGQQCNGKEGCQVLVDPRYMCPDPAFRREKSVVVTYTCNGKQATISFPDSAQLALKCPSTAGSTGSTTTTTTTNTGGGNKPVTPGVQTRSIAGMWTVSSGNSVGDLLFSVSGNRLNGNIYANLISGGNTIEGTTSGTSVEFDRNSVAHQHWSGTIDASGNHISGTVTWPGGSQPWTATRR